MKLSGVEGGLEWMRSAGNSGDDALLAPVISVKCVP